MSGRRLDIIDPETPITLIAEGQSTFIKGEGYKSNNRSQGSYSAQSGEILPQTSYS